MKRALNCAAGLILMLFGLAAQTQTAPQITSLSNYAGTVGSTLGISGISFGGSTGTVTFNGVAASVNSWSNNQINVTIPAGATTGPLVVTAGAASSNGVTFEVGPP